MRIEVEELGKTGKFRGEEVYTHVIFAEKILELARQAKVEMSASGLWNVRDELPEILREKIPEGQASWTVFAQAIKDVDMGHIREGVRRYREKTVSDAKLKADISLLKQHMTNAALRSLDSPAINAPSTILNDNIINLYSVGHEEVTRAMCNEGIEVPFQHTLCLHGPQGEIVRVLALFDGCAMVSAMCVTVFKKVKHRLGNWRKSARRLRMGNGVIVPALVVWKGKMQLGEVIVEGKFEVFDNRGSWAFLLGKPALKQFRVGQDYWQDTVSIQNGDNKRETLANEIKKLQAGRDRPGMNLTLDVKQHDAVAGGSSEMKPPPREASHSISDDATKIYIDKTSAPVYVTSKETSNADPESLLTWESDPYKL